MELPIDNIHNFDTPDTIRNKIGIHYNIDPKYLNNFKLSSNYKKTNVKIFTILDLLHEFEIEESKKIPSFKKFYEKVRNNFNLSSQEILNVWKLHLSYFEDNEDDMLLKFLTAELNNDIQELSVLYPYEFNNTSLNAVPKSMNLKPNKNMIEEITEFDLAVNEFDNTIPTPVSNFEQKKQYITITIDIENKNYPLEYFYDKIQLNDTIPFASYNEYCKILKTFVLNGNTGIYNDTIFLLYKKSKIEFEDDDEDEDEYQENVKTNSMMWFKSYSSILIKKISDEESNYITIEMDVENGVNVDSILQNIEKSLNWPDISLKSDIITTNKISGEFYALKQVIDPIVTKDIIVFHPVLKYMLYSNDNLMSFAIEEFKNKNPYKNILHYVEYTTKSKFVCNITTRMSTRNDIINNPTLKLGEPITVFKIIRGNSIDVIARFQEIISKFITIYNKNVKEITSDYLNYVSNVNARTFSIKDSSLSDISPNIFIDKYSRLCSKQKNPVLTEQEYNENDTSMLLFPKDDENSQVYKCDDDDYAFAGLVVNNLANKNEYPYLPCCFKTDQKNNPKSNYTKYYEDEDEKGQEKKSEYERVLQTQKFANFGSFGVLPEDIAKLLKIFDKSYEYYRRGMHYRNPVLILSSFLECVLDAINWNNITTQTDEKEREMIIKSERESIANFIKNSGLCKQECYNMTIKDIENNIQNLNHYLSPSLYIRAIEEYYNVNIFVFQRNSNTPTGNLIIPNHDNHHGYIFSQLKSRLSILIYEHTGGIWDKQYACELIIHYNPTTLKTMTVFSPDDKIIINLYKQLLQMYPIYEKDNIIKPVQVIDIKNIKSQYIDIYGKTRYIEYKEPSMVIYCQPIPPLNVPVLTKIPKIKNVEIFINKYKLKKITDKVYANDDGFKIYINIESSEDKYLSPLNLSSFVYNKRVSTHLIEYLLYMYSVYLKNLTGSKKTKDSIKEFLNSATTISNNPEYKIDLLVENNPKIVQIESENMRNKLNYIIRVKMLNDRQNIINYHKQKYLNNYYNSIFDFEDYSHQYLIYLKSLDLIMNNIYDTKLYLIPPDKINDSIFFLRYNDKNYLAQFNNILDDALARLYNWNINNINSTVVDINGTLDFKFICVPYVNEQYDEPITVKGYDLNNDTPIIIYSNSQFISLLNF